MQLIKNLGITITLISFLILFTIDIYAQFDPLPCDDPENNGIGCYCESAGILCTPDLLDGFEFSMSDTENLGNLEGDLCPGLNQGGIPNNVNFFAFVVWCEELTIDVLVTNCTDYPFDNIESYGIQMAMFANCPTANGGNWDPISCISSDADACYDNETDVPEIRTFTATDLEIGGTYYFMVDGCFRSTCKITIDVQGVCGEGEITDWETGLTGPLLVCAGDTETYIAEDALVGLDGAEEYYYYLDGVLISDGEELYSHDITWDTPGNYELCVDVSNLPCILESDTPGQNCITVEVAGLGSGDISADPTTICPDESSNILVSNHNTDPLMSNNIVIVNQDGTVIQVEEGISTELTYDLCGELTAYYFSFSELEDLTIPGVGDVWVVPDCMNDCCYLDEVVISIEDGEAPVFTNEPDDMVLDCGDDIIHDDLVWTDNCSGTGMVAPTVVENFDLCGGIIERTWSFTDNCSNSIEHTQIVTIDPIPAPAFVNPPGDGSINCEEIQLFVALDLSYTNGESGACNISGSVAPILSGIFDVCGGTVTANWAFTDLCGRTISHSQTIAIEPLPEVSFVNPPSSITITCEEWETFEPETLSYTNNQTGECEISGIVIPVSNEPQNPCGNDITYIWEFSDLCGRIISHTQVVTVEPALSTNSLKKEHIDIYPNPASHKLNVKSDYQITSLSLTTLKGKIVYNINDLKLNNTQIDVSYYSTGLYMLQVETEEGSWVEKIIIE